MINVENFKNLKKEEIFSTLTGVTEYWLNHFYSNGVELDTTKLESYISKMYKNSNLKMPSMSYIKKAVILDKSLNTPDEDNNNDQNIFEVYFESILLDIYNNSNLMKLETTELFDEINDYIVKKSDFYVRFFNFKYYDSSDENFINHNYQSYNHIMLYDLFKQLNVVNDSNLDEYLDFVKCGAFSFITKPNICIVYDRPTKVSIDENNRLHSEDSPALVFNGIEKYHWHGVEIDSRYLLAKDSLTKNDIVGEKNAEKRRCLKEILGSKKYAELLNIEIIDQDIDAKGNPVKLYRTKEVDDIINKHLYFANVTCPSTGREYFLSVPEMDNIWEAVGWTFQMNKEKYKLTNES